MKIYLAGPDVFREDHLAHGKSLKGICEKYGAVGLWPMDNEIADGLGDEPDRIRQANMAMIRECDAVLGKIVIGYTRATGSYLQRVQNFYAKALVEGHR